MDHLERRVLKVMKGEILANLVLENCVLDTLEQADTLTEDMAHRIKVGGYKMDHLERRVLKVMKGEILANFVLENCVLDTLEQADTLTEDMAHRIKVGYP